MATASIEQEIHRIEARRRLYSGILLIVVAATMIAGFLEASRMNSGSFFGGLKQFWDYPGEIVIEAWQSGTAFFGLLVHFIPALVETINIALVATIFGGLGALVLSFLASRSLEVWPPLIPVVRRIMDVTRAFPELIIALFLIFVLGGGPIPAMIAVAFHTTGALGKLFSEVNDNVDRKPIEGLRACGASWLQRMRFAVIPQVLPNFLSYFLLRLEINVRASAILGYVGAGGLGTELRRTIGWGQGAGDETAAIFVLLILTIVAVDQLSSYLRQRLTRSDRAH
ncbi:MAG: phosphonate ABC transporter, permease protein PhnE [Rhizobiales bacterium]|nr:phosphonate ABC transporter, permease protein PhnE [Hyphomicrobiales bacterium]